MSGHCGHIVVGLRSLWQHDVRLGHCGNIKLGQCALTHEVGSVWEHGYYLIIGDTEILTDQLGQGLLLGGGPGWVT